MNVNGGAIAIGHQLGCDGARISTTLVHEMKRRGNQWGLSYHVRRCRAGCYGRYEEGVEPLLLVSGSWF